MHDDARITLLVPDAVGANCYGAEGVLAHPKLGTNVAELRTAE